MQRGSPVDVFDTLLAFYSGGAFFLAGTEPGKAECVLLFSAGKSLEKFIVGKGTEFFRPRADIHQAGKGKDFGIAFVVEVFQTVKVGQSDAVASVEVL